MDAVGCFESDQEEDDDDEEEIEAEEEFCKQVGGVGCSWLLEPRGALLLGGAQTPGRHLLVLT